MLFICKIFHECWADCYDFCWNCERSVSPRIFRSGFLFWTLAPKLDSYPLCISDDILFGWVLRLHCYLPVSKGMLRIVHHTLSVIKPYVHIILNITTLIWVRFDFGGTRKSAAFGHVFPCGRRIQTKLGPLARIKPLREKRSHFRPKSVTLTH